jgi:hypothetical protein
MKSSYRNRAYAVPGRSWTALKKRVPALLVLALGAGCDGGGAASPASGVSLESFVAAPDTLDFGSLEVGQTSTRTVQVSNTGPTAIARLRISFAAANTADFTQTNTCTATNAAGTDCTINVTFKPSSGGPRATELLIASSTSAFTRTIPVTGAGKMDALAALRAAASRRVDVLMIGDSNQLFGGSGWDHGFQYRLGTLYGIYATGMVSANDGGLGTPGSGSGAGLGYARIFAGDGAATGAPAALDAAMPAGSTPPHHYYFIASGATGNGSGVSIAASSPLLDLSRALRGHFVYGGFTGDAGSFVPFARLGSPPYSVLATGPAVTTNLSAHGIAYAQLEVPAAARTGSIEFRDRDANGGAGIKGPYLGYYYRVEWPEKTSGVSVHTAFAVGGFSLFEIAQKILAAPDAQLHLQLSEARRLQVAAGQTPVVVVVVNAGLNDRNETSTPSLGPAGVADADSATAYIDNLQAIVDRVESVYRANWPLNELYWLIMPSHRVADPDDPELVSYRAAVNSWVNGRERTSMIDLASNITAAEMLTRGYFAAGNADLNHLTVAGYEGLATTYLVGP